MKSCTVSVSTVYTLAMAKKVSIQMKTGNTLVIAADKVEEDGKQGYNGYILTLTNAGQHVGKFDGSTVAGWWISEAEN